MKLYCQGLDLSDAALKVVKACATKTTLPVLECIKLSAQNDTLTLCATDGEISITKKIKADILEEGELCVPGKYFCDFIKKLEGTDLTLSTKDKTMTIKYADNESSMQVLNCEDFPKINNNINEKSFAMKTSELKKSIDVTCFCCATDDARPILKGCQIIANKEQGTVCFTALDGFRLATYTTEVLDATDYIEIVCPARTLNEIQKMLPSGEGETRIFVQRGMILVCVDDTILTSRLFRESEFLNKENIIAKTYTTSVLVEKKIIIQSLERAAVLARMDKNNLVTFTLSKDQMEIVSMSDLGKVQETIAAEVEGKEDFSISMNSKYILDAVSALEEDMIKMSFNTKVQPFIVENENDKSILYLILPIRTANNA